MPRETYVKRQVRAGCFVCHESTAGWTGGNSQGVAARHHDATGHATWVEVEMFVYYGTEQPPAGPSASASLAGQEQDKEEK